ncbi:hypothetical protein ACSFBF_00655 [Variovorax sp. ZT5P49]|uniref:hypothetical protein n=1 Tax=Variovorax sp. ZT5P49 TaxID=3443733 RepID=UPI003F479529
MKSVHFKLMALSAVAAASMIAGAASAQTVTGGGASLPALLYQDIIGGGPILGTWTYTSSSSGTGKSTFLTGSTFNYAGSDSALTSADLATYTNGATWGPIFQVPSVATPVLLPYKETNVTTLNLTTAQVCRIFSFQPSSRTWNQVTTAADDGAVGSASAIAVVFRNEAAGSGTTELLARFLNAACGPFLPAGKSFTVSNVFKNVVATALPTLTAAQDANGDGIPDVWVGAAGSGGVKTALATDHRFGYLSPDVDYTGNANNVVARIDGLLPTEASVQAALPAPPSGADRLDPLKWVPAYAIPSGAYPIFGTTNLLLGQCYAGGFGSGTRGAAVKDFLTNFNTSAYDSYITSRHFVRLPAAWKTAISDAFLTGADGNGLAFGNSADCNGIAGRP